MNEVYRILRRPYARSPLSGEGAHRFGGRWSSPGNRIAYVAEHLSLAIIEYFVHVDEDDPPDDLVLIRAQVPEGVSRISVKPKDLPPNWRTLPAPPELARLGDRFVRERRAAILIVPSALAPTECNWLINPEHPHSARIRVEANEPFVFDLRFFKQ